MTLLVFVTACGGGGSTTVSAPVTTFTPVSRTPAAGTVAMLAGGSVGATITIRVVVTDVNNFFGAAFRVTYDATALRFNSMDSATSFLLTGTASDVFFSADATSQPGVAVVTATRLDPTKVLPVNVSGTQDLLTLSFSARKPIPPSGTTGVLAFGDPKQVCDGTVAAPGCGAVVISAWDGGTIVSQTP